MNALYIFNPDHDLCLANGDKHYVPPRSALDFSEGGKEVMQMLYGTDSCCVSSATLFEQVGSRFREQWNTWCGTAEGGVPSAIVPWGWNSALRYRLQECGAPDTLLPTDAQLATWRRLQHRSTAVQLLQWLSGQTGSLYPAYVITEPVQLEALLATQPKVVLKAPWSGSGRGLRWVVTQPMEQDLSWLRKVLAQQGCVIAEPWLDVLQDFAMEFVIESSVSADADPQVHFMGYSLFDTHAGVYAYNRLWSDAQIETVIGTYIPVTQLRHIRLLLLHWLAQHIAPYYQGPIGIDMFVHNSSRGPRLRPAVEINLRHTMGQVAHAYLQHHPEAAGQRLCIQHTPQYHVTVLP